MAQRLIAQVAVEQTTFHFDRLYSYDAQTVSDDIACGCRVLVPFGKGNRHRQGIVMQLHTLPSDDATPFKPITEVLDRQPLLDERLLELALFLKDRTFCTVFDAVRAMVPAGLCMHVKPVYTPVPSPEETVAQLTDEQRQLYTLACSLANKYPDGIPSDTLLRLAGIQSASALPETLCKKGLFIRNEEAYRRASDATQRMVRLTFSSDEREAVEKDHRLTPKQKQVIELLCMAGTASVKEVCYLSSVTAAVTDTLCKKGLAEYYERETLRSPTASVATTDDRPIALNAAQQTAFDELYARYAEPQPACALLYGVTGSGKTQVYMSLIDRVLQDGKQVIVLVPEISLTPQTVQLFTARYGNRVAVLHSGLSMGERMDEYKRIRRGDARVVVGTRSAVFAPCAELGLIVMDEEQEHTYKSESSPRYHARQVAKFRVTQHNALLLLTSATPSIESYYAALNGRYSLHTLPSRYGDTALPTVQTVDMRLEEVESELFSAPLTAQIGACLQQNRQAVLLLNRRGYQTTVSCRNCGEVMLCPSCSIPMTYHRANGQLMCHYCGHTRPAARHCPSCGSDKVRYTGQGTQKIEEQLETLFPTARILRMDADAASSRYAYEEKLNAFARGEYDILIGTQMVAKGLDFPNVALVGVLSADRSLYEGDFRAYEKAFALFTQVVGRAGRREQAGQAVLQTTVPDHPVIRLASEQNYPAFYETELAVRRTLNYPPFADLCMFGFSGADEAAVAQAAKRLLNMLKQTVAKPPYDTLPLIALDPTPATVLRVAGKYRYKLLIKCKNTTATRRMITELLTAFADDAANRGVSVYADMDPLNIL